MYFYWDCSFKNQLLWIMTKWRDKIQEGENKHLRVKIKNHSVDEKDRKSVDWGRIK